MKKLSKRIGLYGFLLCMMLVLSTGQVWAANKSITLKQNKEVTQKADKKKKKKYDSYYYKLSVPGEGFITLSIKKGKKAGSSLTYNLYREPGEPIPFCADSIAGKGKADIRIPMDKGTVYLKTTAGNKVKWKFTKVAPPSNYSPQTAMSLKKGKKVTVCQSPQCSFNRWFKVTLTNNQKLSFWAEAGKVVKVYDEDFAECSVKHAGAQSLKYSTAASLKAGTYYLCMYEIDYNTDEASGAPYINRFYYSSLYWK